MKQLFAILLIALPVLAADEKEISRATQDLAARDFKTREVATQILWQAGRAAIPALEQAAASHDPEVATRAREILANLRLGISPSTLPSVQPLLQQYQAGDAAVKKQVLQELVSKGRVGKHVAAALLSTEPNDSWRTETAHELTGDITDSLPAKIIGGNLDDVEGTLELLAIADEPTDNGCYETLSAIRNYAAFLQWRGRLDEVLEDFRIRFALQPTAGLARGLALLSRSNGDLIEARRAAEKADDPNLLIGILAELGKWEEVAALAEGEKAKGNGASLACLATYHRLAGQPEICDRYLDQLWSQSLSGKATGPPIFPQDAFAVNGQPERALELKQKGWPAAAVSDFCLQRRFDEALAFNERQKDAKPETIVPVLINTGKLLYFAGEPEKCAALLQSALAKYGDNPNERKQIVTAALETHCFKIVAADLAAGPPPPWHPFSGLVPDVSAASPACWKALRELYPTDPLEQSLNREWGILSGESAGEVVTPVITAAAQFAQTDGPVLLALSRLSDFAGASNLAIKCAQKAAKLVWKDNPGDADMQLGQLLLKQKRWQEAAEQFAQVQAPHHVGVSLLLQGYALSNAGQIAEGERLMKTAEIVPLAGGCEGRADALRVAAELGLTKWRDRQLELVRRTGAFFQDCDCAEPLAVAESAAAKGNYLQAAAIRERMLFSLVCGGSINCGDLRDGFDGKRDLWQLSWIHEWRARGLLKDGKIREALQEAKLYLRYLPAGIDLLVSLVPELDRLGHRSDGDELFGQVFERLQKLVSSYPRFASGHHELARLCLGCGRRLEEGAAHARKAVELNPTNAGYGATLQQLTGAQTNRNP